MVINNYILIMNYTVVPLSARGTSQDPQWMSETVGSTEPYIYYIFSYTYIPVIKFNLIN